MFSRTIISTTLGALGTFALLSSAALPAQAASAPSQRTIMVSHTDTKKIYDTIITFHAGKAMTAATAAKVKATLAKKMNAPEKISGATASGPNGAQLYCDNAYNFSDSDGTFSFQHSCGGTTGPWGYKLSPGVCSLIPGGEDGDVLEIGMSWSRNGRLQGTQADHLDGFCGRQFHGTFNPDHDGDHIVYKDDFIFTVEVDGETGTANVAISGSFTSLGCQNRIACGP